MKISIITVCFNAKDTIEDTFLSVFNQSYEHIELIVIDGVSTDGTIDIINKYKDKISHFVSEPDEGIYDAMNKGIELATGDFIIFMNANDTFYDQKVLEKVANALLENPEVKFLFGDVDCVSIDTNYSEIQTYEKIKNKFELLFNNICHQSIFYHKSLFEECGLFSLEYKICSDWDFNIKCLVKHKTQALYLKLPIAKFQLGGRSSSQDSLKICQKENRALLKKYSPVLSFLVRGNIFFKKQFFVQHRVIVRNPFSRKLFKMYASQKKYKLNIIKPRD